MEETYKYEAFISYRHTMPDAAVAKRLHTMIETFSVPKHISKATGRQKLGRVFRDEDELPLSGDLGADIHNALEQSRWLIVICSPRLLESVWCMTEIETFIAMGRQDHILTVLVDGEPTDSFPPQLRFAQVDGQEVEKEPLAADVRGASQAEILNKLGREKLRILAPMLGVSYDDLRQRARARRLRIIVGATATAFILLSSFLVYAIVQNKRISAERAAAQEGQSLYLADFSERALAEGDRMLALLLALEGLPKDPENPDRPVVQQTVSALRSAVVSQGGDNVYSPVTTIFQKNIESWRAAGENLVLYSPDAEGYLRYFDLLTGRDTTAEHDISAELEFMQEEPDSVWFNYELFPRIMYQDKAFFSHNYYDTVETMPEETDWFATESAAGFTTTLLYGENAGSFLLKHRSYGAELITQDRLLTIEHAVPVWGSETDFVIGGYMNYRESKEGPLVIIYRRVTSAEDEILHEYAGVEMQGSMIPNVLQVGISSQGDAVMGRSWSEVYVWNAATEEPVHTLTAEKLGGFDPVYAAFTPGKEPWLAVVTDAGTLLLYNYITGEQVVSMDMGLARATTVQWSADGTRLLCACEDECARIWMAATGELFQTIPATGALVDASFGQTTQEGCSADDSRIVLQGRDFLDIYAYSAKGEGTSGGVFIPLSGFAVGGEISAAFSPNGNTAWVLDHQSDLGSFLYAFDAVTGERLGSFENECMSIMPHGEDEIFTWYTTPYADDPAQLYIYDTDTVTLKTLLTPSYPHVYDAGGGYMEDRDNLFNIKGITSSEDGRYLLFNAGGTASKRTDACVFVYDTATWEELWHFGIYNPKDPGEYVFPCAADWGRPCSTIFSYFTADGEYVISVYGFGGDYRVVEARRTSDGEQVCVIPVYDESAVPLYPRFDADYTAVYMGNEGGTSLNRVSTLTGETLETIALPGPVMKTFYYKDDGHLRITVAGENGEETPYFWTPGMSEAALYTPPADSGVRDDDHEDTTAAGLRDTDRATPDELEAYPGFYSKHKSLSPYSSMRTTTGSLLYGDEWCLLSDWSLKGTFTGDTKVVLGTPGDVLSVYACAADGSALLVHNYSDGGTPSILRYADLPTLVTAARTILDGRTLTEQELEEYYISVGS